MEVLKVNNLKKYYGNNTNITKALNKNHYLHSVANYTISHLFL